MVCVAAGNGNRDATLADDNQTPIKETGSILVGATAFDPTDNVPASFSNFGSTVVVCAPGDSLHDLTCASTADSAYRNGFGGTSGATPKVAGTAALILEMNSALSHNEVRDILSTTGLAIMGKAIGTFLQADAAVQRARP